MASVVFMRAVNVGGHQKFRPSVLAKKLASLGAVNIGAAGTFVVRESVSVATLRREILSQLPFEPELMICVDRDVIELEKDDPFRGAGTDGKDVRAFASVLESVPARGAKRPPLPVELPAGAAWQVRIIALRGQFALSVWRRSEKPLLYPNPVVEKHFGVSATTRSWNTIAAVCKILRQ